MFAYGGGRRGAGCRCSGADPPPSPKLPSVAEAGYTATAKKPIQGLEEKLWEWTAVDKIIRFLGYIHVNVSS